MYCEDIDRLHINNWVEANEFMICIGHTTKTLVDCATAYDMDIDFSLKLPHKAKELNALSLTTVNVIAVLVFLFCFASLLISLLYCTNDQYIFALWQVHKNTHYNVMCVWNQCYVTNFKLNERCGHTHTHIHKRNDFIDWRFNDSNERLISSRKIEKLFRTSKYYNLVASKDREIVRESVCFFTLSLHIQNTFFW